MTGLPTFMQGYTSRNLASTALTSIGSGAPPTLSIEGGRFTIIDATGQNEIVGAMDPKIGLYVDLVIVDLLERKSKIYYGAKYDASNPTQPEYGSLNLAQAVQLLSYDWRQALGGFPVVERTRAPVQADATAVRGLLGHWREMLVEIGFLDPAVPRKLMARLHQLVNRAQVTTEEVHILRGIAAPILLRRNSNLRPRQRQRLLFREPRRRKQPPAKPSQAHAFSHSEILLSSQP